MGSFTQHAMVAFVVITVSWLLLLPHGWNWGWSAVGVFLLGNVFPDIDHTKSRTHRYLLFPRIYGRRFTHWGRCHTVIGAVLFSTPLLVIEVIAWHYTGWRPLAWILFLTGQILHMVVDEIYKSKNNRRRALKIWYRGKKDKKPARGGTAPGPGNTR